MTRARLVRQRFASHNLVSLQSAFDPGEVSPDGFKLMFSQATRRPLPKDLSGFIHFRAGSNIFELASTTHTLPRRHTAAELTKMVLSAPAEPIFLVGVALGVLIAGAIFALNMRRWRAQQRLR